MFMTATSKRNVARTMARAIVSFEYLKGDDVVLTRADGRTEHASWTRLRPWLEEIYLSDSHIRPNAVYMLKGTKNGLPVFMRIESGK